MVNRMSSVRSESTDSNNKSIDSAGTASAGTASTLWIIGSWSDLLLIIAPPLLIPPLLYAVRAVFSAEDITLYILGFLATGHHLPGLMRAYGDRALFQRFQTRFLIAPVILLSTSLFFALRDMQGLMVIAVVWGFWHATMQTYGFLRIYDAKVKLVDRLTARLDLLMCIAWFGLGIVHSPGRKADWLSTWMIAGGRLPDAINFEVTQLAWSIGTGLITIAFVANTARNAVAGQKLNPVKFLTMVSSFGFWWYSMVGIRNAVLGVALFEIFHDVQYLAIVWSFNRARVDRSPDVGAFTRFVFRRSWIMACLYVLAVAVYGFLGLAPDVIKATTTRQIFFGIGTASLLLHFYYDGFIWKVRDRSIQDGLRVREQSPGSGAGTATDVRVGWFKHCAKWSLFIIPVCLIGFAGRQGTTLSVDEYRAVVTSVPDSWKVRLELALNVDDPRESLHELQLALAINPDNALVHYHLGNALLRQNDLSRARQHFDQATRLKPDFADAFGSLGSVHFLQNHLDAAKSSFNQCLSFDPENTNAHDNLGCVLDRQGEYADAIEHFHAAIRLNFDGGQVRNNLGLALLHRGNSDDLDNAARQFETAIDRQPDFKDAYFNLGLVKLRQQKRVEAVRQFRKTVSLDPDFVPALHRLAWLLSTTGNRTRQSSEAIAFAERGATLTDHQDATILHALATAHAHAGTFEAACEAIDQALDVARQTGAPELIENITFSAEQFHAGKTLAAEAITKFETTHY